MCRHVYEHAHSSENELIAVWEEGGNLSMSPIGVFNMLLFIIVNPQHLWDI